jgi:hypothetical protein
LRDHVSWTNDSVGANHELLPVRVRNVSTGSFESLESFFQRAWHQDIVGIHILDVFAARPLGSLIPRSTRTLIRPELRNYCIAERLDDLG